MSQKIQVKLDELNSAPLLCTALGHQGTLAHGRCKHGREHEGKQDLHPEVSPKPSQTLIWPRAYPHKVSSPVGTSGHLAGNLL